MAEELAAKQVEVAGQIICELIKKDILPSELRKPGGMSAADFAEILGRIYQIIWKAIYTAPHLNKASRARESGP